MAAQHINAEQFHTLIAKDAPVLVDFWAPWCSYCRKIDSAYDQIAQQYAGKLTVVKVNIDDEEALSDAEGIELIPTLRIYQNGQVKGQIVAPESLDVIEAFIGSAMPAPKEDQPVYDMVIIGGGPAGYTAALYAARAGMETLVIERLSAGGQMALTHQIDNYPGFDEGVDGYELSIKMQKQAHRFGVKTLISQVKNLDLQANPKVIETRKGAIRAKTVVLAMGANPRPLGIAHEKELIGRGVAYCAACDGMFYKDKTVVVVGGGNSAAADALLLSRIAQKVILVHRRDSLRATKIYHDPLMQAESVDFQWNHVVQELLYDDKLTGVRVKNVQTSEETVIPCDGLFVSIGREPASQLVEAQLPLDESGYIIADESTQTGIPGVYAVGDIRSKPLRQIVTAVADGATAVHMAEQYLASL